MIVLFIGVFSALSDDSSVNTSVEGLSSEVIAYTPVIEKYALESGIGDYVSLIQAVMMQESGGKGNDPMQSSECGFNEKYPRVHNGITDADYSIKVGIQHLAGCLNDTKIAHQFTFLLNPYHVQYLLPLVVPTCDFATSTILLFPI